MINDEPTVPRLVAIDRRQPLLRTVDVEKLVDDEHSVRAIWELIGRLDLRLYHAQIAAVEGSAGREPVRKPSKPKPVRDASNKGDCRVRWKSYRSGRRARAEKKPRRKRA
jgi:hypothetical protein